MNHKPENRIPLLFTDFDNMKDFPWLFKKFPDFSNDLEKFSFYCWLFCDNGNRDDKDGKVSTVCEPVHVYEYSTAFVSRAENYWIIWLSISQVGL